MELARDYTDRLVRALWRRAPDALVHLALARPGVRVRQLVDTNPALVRRAPDGAALVDGPDGAFVAHVEFETSGTPEVVRRAAMYGLLLHEDHGLPVRSAVILLEPAPVERDAFVMEHAGDELCRYNVRVVRLYDVPASDLAASLDLAVLAPLGRDAGVEELRQARRTLWSQAAPGERGDLLAALYIMGGRRFGLPQMQALFDREELMESVTYRAIVEESFQAGVERGIEKGIEKGIERGVERGVEEGLERGIERGREEQRALVRGLAELRFPDALPGLAPLLARADFDDLRAIAEAVMLATSPDQLLDLAAARLHDTGD